MNVKPIVKPEINPCFFKGEIILWHFRETITPVHGEYAFRFDITFADGTTVKKEKSGFATRALCQKAKELTITQLNNHQFVAFKVTIKEFYDYWLYYHMAETIHISYNTFMSYKNIIYNYLVPYIGKRKLHSIKRNDLICFFDMLNSPALLKMGYGVIGSSFQFAKSNNLINLNVAITAIKAKRSEVKKERRNSGIENLPQKRPVLNTEQMYNLLWTCEADEHDLFIPLLITIASGCRISELIALKLNNINVRTGELQIKNQLGKEIYSNNKVGEICKQHVKVKSHAGERTILLPEFIIDEIILTRARYDILKKTNPGFQDNGYIWCQSNGSPHGRGDYNKPFKRLKNKLNLPDGLHWHDLRHSYCTLMVQNGANLKQLSIAMGHYSELFSVNVYTDMDFIISNGFPEFDSFIDSVLPEPLESEYRIVDATIDFNYLDSVIPV